MNFGHAVAYTFGKITKGNCGNVNRSFSPGPNKYYPTMYTLRNPPGFKMGPPNLTDIRQSGPKTNIKTPGVGNYTIPNTFGQGPKWSLKGPGNEPELSKTNVSPGPKYYPSLIGGAPKYSLGKRIEHLPDNFKFPGVGDYELRTNRSLNVPSYRFGNELKGDTSNMANNPSNYNKFSYEVPSPNNYAPNDNLCHNATPKFSFGKDSRGDKTKHFNPAPGQYNFNQKFGHEGPISTMHGGPLNPINKTQKNFEVSPGPAAYNNTSMYTKPNPKGFKFGTTGRDMPNIAIKNGNPGPGEYSQDKAHNKLLTSAPSWGMGSGITTGMPPELKNREYSPSPGDYNIGKNMGFGPKYSFGYKITDDNRWKNSIPAPNNYNNDTTNVLKKNPGWKIGTERRGDEYKANFKNDNPGPDCYDTRRSFIGKGCKFDKNPRMPNEKSFLAGPGSYKIPCSIVDVNPYTRSAGKFEPQFKFV